MRVTKTTFLILTIFYFIVVGIFIFIFESSRSSAGIWKELSFLLFLTIATQIKILPFFKNKLTIFLANIFVAIFFGTLDFIWHEFFNPTFLGFFGLIFVIFPAAILGAISGIIILMTSKIKK